MLEERRDASNRWEVLNAERERIGEIKIYWEVDEDGYATENRIGFEVGPEGSALEKLVRAYVVMGGNPLDISYFMSPNDVPFKNNSPEEVEESDGHSSPGRGMLTPLPIKYSFDTANTDRDGTLLAYRESRGAGAIIAVKEVQILRMTNQARNWIKQEIHFKRTKMEEQIIKLMDLREQLDKESLAILWATYGDMLNEDDVYDSERFTDGMCAGSVAYFFDSIFRIPEEDNTVNYNNSAEAGEPGSPNIAILSGFTNLISDLPEENNSTV